jgi:hypothetical protein
MNFSRLARFVVAACLFTIVPDSFPAEPVKEELAEATTWFNGLAWPDVRGKRAPKVNFAAKKLAAPAIPAKVRHPRKRA